MSAIRQTPARRATYQRASVWGLRVEFLLYGLNEAGEPVLAERLGADQRPKIRDLALQRLAHHHAVEVWEGPTCILRLKGGPTGGRNG